MTIDDFLKTDLAPAKNLTGIQSDRIREAAAAPRTPSARPGCGRVYLDVGKGVRRGSPTERRLEDATGGRLMPAPGFGYRVLYLGYDNSGGRELARGEALEAAFRAEGLQAHLDFHAD